MKQKLIGILFLMLLIMGGCQEKPTLNIGNSFDNSNRTSQITIHVDGAVMFPGIYKIDQDALLFDLIALAGGLTAQADISQLNLVALLNNNQKITIPFIANNNNPNLFPDLININTANTALLETLPGIGTAKALAIVTYRNQNGYFQSIENIKQVGGIGDEVFNQIKDKITV